MKSISDQYRDLKEGKLSQSNFMRNLRMTLPQYITNTTPFDTSIRILKGKGLLCEEKERKGSSGKQQYEQFTDEQKVNTQEYTLGMSYEHRRSPDKTEGECDKAVLKNIKKDANYYTNWKLTGIEGYELQTMDSSKPEDHQMKPVKDGNLVDKARGMKLVKTSIEVKSQEKPKVDSKKALVKKKKSPKVTILSLVAKGGRGIKKMDATGEKLKKVIIKEEIEHVDWDNISYKNACALYEYCQRTGRLPYGLTPEKYDEIVSKYKLKSDNDHDIDPAGGHGIESHVEEAMPFQNLKADDNKYKIQKDEQGNVIQATNDEGQTFKIGDEALAIDNGQKIKISSFQNEQGKIKALYDVYARPIDIDGLKPVVNADLSTNPSDKRDLGNSFDKLKNKLKEIIRKEIKAISK